MKENTRTRKSARWVNIENKKTLYRKKQQKVFQKADFLQVTCCLSYTLLTANVIPV